MTAGLALLMSLLGIAGCQKNERSLPRAQGNAAVSAGRTAFAAYGCAGCHAIDGQGGPKGPDLAHIGAKPGNTLDVLMLKIRNHRPMPGFQGRISARDLVALGGYLAGLK